MEDNVAYGNFSGRRYSEFGVPCSDEIIQDLAIARGSVDEFLNRHAEGDRDGVLFQVLLRLKQDKREKEWQDLIAVGDMMQCQLLHAKLLRVNNSVESFDTGDAIKVLERLQPEVWQKKSITKDKGKSDKKLDALVSKELE